MIYLLFIFISPILGAYYCPDNVPYFDLNPCNETARNQCPCGYGCRPATFIASDSSKFTKYICCETQSMTVAQWYTENDLSPRFIPQIPLTLLDSVFISRDDRARTTGEEVSMLSNKAFTFGPVTSVNFPIQFSPGPQGYLHILTAIDPKKIHSALFLTYNIPSEGNSILDLTNPNRQMAVVVGNEALTASETYRSLYVVLAFQTENMIRDPSVDLLNSKGDISMLLINSTCSRELGAPRAGSMLWVTAQSTIFPLKPEVVTPSPWKLGSSCYYNIVLITLLIMSQL